MPRTNAVARLDIPRSKGSRISRIWMTELSNDTMTLKAENPASNSIRFRYGHKPWGARSRPWGTAFPQGSWSGSVVTLNETASVQRRARQARSAGGARVARPRLGAQFDSDVSLSHGCRPDSE